MSPLLEEPLKSCVIYPLQHFVCRSQVSTHQLLTVLSMMCTGMTRRYITPGVESSWRYVLKYTYVIDGRPLVKKFRESCQRCRYLIKKALNVSMGPISKDNLVIAPAYYVCEANLVGTFTAYSYHNKRTKIKIWMVVFCCNTTKATNIKVMERYDTSSFLQAFMRFCCDVG